MSQYVSKIPKHIQSKEEKGKKIAAIEAEEEVAEITGDGDRETRLVGGGSRRHGAASDGERWSWEHNVFAGGKETDKLPCALSTPSNC
ncbi:hypothetical protein Droror1_Dr00025842 [Drosera rotundifolia]